MSLALNGRDGLIIPDPTHLRFTNGDNDGATAPLFTYYTLPALLPISPRAALADGGTAITLSGRGLGSFGDLSSTFCRIGGYVTGAISTSDEAVVCVAPTAADLGPNLGPELGPVGVELTLNGQDYQVLHT